MTFKFYVGKRVNSRGQVELSLRFRAGKIDQQAVTNIRIAFAGEDGEVAYPPDVADRMKRLVAYVEDAYCLSRRRKPGKGWLAETIERFHEEQVPLIEEEMRSVPALIDALPRRYRERALLGEPYGGLCHDAPVGCPLRGLPTTETARLQADGLAA